MNTDDQIVEELREVLAPELHLLSRLGSGGMGDVFLARDPVLKRNVAVKVLAQRFSFSEQARLRFAREGEAAAAVAHPNVVPIYRVGTLPRSELGYIVMAHVDGPSLRELVPEGTVASESEVRRIIAEVASALAAAHARGVIHRDIKPANVLYDPLGGRFVVVDFGIAAVLNRDSDSGRLTMEGVPVGTPTYMSPEQATGDAAGEKSDVYSLGCLGYELVTGRPPITGPTVAAVVRGHLVENPPPVTSLRSDLSPDFAALLMRCLRKDPDERPDAEEVTRALGGVRRATIEWPPPGLERLHRLGALWYRTAGRFALALLMFVLVLGIHPTAARPCCADLPDRSPGWVILKRLSMITPIHFDDPDSLSIWYFLLDATFFVLLAAAVPLVFRTIGLSRVLAASRRAGYPIAVLGRVGWDRHQDTGDLINLTGRYALVEPERQARQLRLRSIAAGLLGLAVVLLMIGCLAWLGGAVELVHGASAGLLPFAELAALILPAAAAVTGYLVLEAIDLRHRGAPRLSSARRPPLRADVLKGWLTAAAVRTPVERWSPLGLRIVGAVAVAVGLLTVAVATYGLIAVFGASARFAGGRAAANEWLTAHLDYSIPDSVLTPLTGRIALSLTAAVPIDRRVARLMVETRLTEAERRLLVESVGPAFCLNPREVLFGVAPARLEQRERVARLGSADSTSALGEFEAEQLRNGGVAGLRRRARYCAQYFGDQATISPGTRSTS